MAEDYNVLAHLRKILALLSVFDALMMSQELRDLLINALQNPEKYQSHFAERRHEESLCAETLYVNSRANGVTFTEEGPKDPTAK